MEGHRDKEEQNFKVAAHEVGEEQNRAIEVAVHGDDEQNRTVEVTGREGEGQNLNFSRAVEVEGRSFSSKVDVEGGEDNTEENLSTHIMVEGRRDTKEEDFSNIDILGKVSLIFTPHF